MSLNGHAACPTGERCFLIMGKQLAPDGQNWFLRPARYIHIFRVQPTHAIPAIWQFLSSANHPDGIPLICKLSRQLADNREIVNCLFVRILQQKTRQSDSFSEILGFSKNQRYVQLSLILIKLIPPTGWEEPVLMWFPKVLLVGNISYPSICVFLHKTLQVAIKFLLLWKLKPESAVRACLDFVILEEWILFGF